MLLIEFCKLLNEFSSIYEAVLRDKSHIHSLESSHGDSNEYIIRLIFLIQKIFDTIIVSNNEFLFELCLENNVITLITELFLSPHQNSIQLNIAILQSLCMLVQNLKEPEMLYALLSQPCINRFILSFNIKVWRFSQKKTAPLRRYRTWPLCICQSSSQQPLVETQSDVYVITKKNMPQKLHSDALRFFTQMHIKSFRNQREILRATERTNIFFLIQQCKVSNVENTRLDCKANAEELLSWAICFLRSLAFRINETTWRLFCSNSFPQFPVLMEAIRFLGAADSLIRTQAYSIVLHICQVRALRSTLYFPKNVWFFETLLFHWIHRWKFLQKSVREVFSLTLSKKQRIAISEKCRNMIDQEREFIEFSQDLLSMNSSAFHEKFWSHVIISGLLILLDSFATSNCFGIAKRKSTIMLSFYKQGMCDKRNQVVMMILKMLFICDRGFSLKKNLISTLEQGSSVVDCHDTFSPNVVNFICANLIKNISNTNPFSLVVTRLMCLFFLAIGETNRRNILTIFPHERYQKRYISLKFFSSMLEKQDSFARLISNWIQTYIIWKNGSIEKKGPWKKEWIHLSFWHLKTLQISFLKALTAGNIGISVFCFLIYKMLKHPVSLSFHLVNSSWLMSRNHSFLPHMQRKCLFRGSTSQIKKKTRAVPLLVDILISCFEKPKMIRCASDTRWTACVLLVLIQRIINEILNILISQLIAQNNLNVLENENGEWGYLLEHIIDETTHSGLVCYMSRAIQVIMEVDKRLFKIQKRLGHKAVRLFNMQSMTSSQTFLLYLNEWKKVRTGLSHVCETGISLSSLFGDIKLDHHFDAQQQKNTFMNEFASDQRPFEVLNDHDLLKFNFESFFILRRVRYHLCDIFCHFLHTLAEIGLLQHECLPRTTTQSRILQLKNSDPDLISSPCLLGRNLMEMCPLDLEWPPLVQGTQGFHTNAWHPLPLILDSNHFNLLSETFKILIEALLKRFFHLPSIQRNWLTSLQFILDPKYSSLTQGSQLSHAPFKLNCVEKRDGCFTFSNVSQQMPSSEWETLLKREVYNNSLSLSSFFKSRPEPGLPVSFWRNLLLSSFNGSTYDICCVHQKLLTLKGATLYCIFLIHKKIPLLYIGPGRRRKVHSESRRSLRHTYHYYSTRNETMKSNWVEHPKVSSSCYFNGCYCCSLPLHDIPVTFSLNIVFKVSVMLREQEHEGFFYNISPLMIHVMSILGIHSPNSGTSLNVVNRYVAVTSRVILFLCKKPHGKTVELKEVLPLSSILLISETPTPLPQLYIDFFTQNEARIPFPKNHLTYMGTVSSYNALLHQTIHGDLQASKSRKFNNQNNISYLFKLPDCPLHSSTNHDTTTIELMAYADVYRLCIQFKSYTDKFALLERIQVCFREMSNYTISRLNQMFYRCDPPWRS